MKKTFGAGGVAQGEEPLCGVTGGVVDQQLGEGPLQLVWITVEEVGESDTLPRAELCSAIVLLFHTHKTTAL
jgi:hypothetical protein